MYSRARVAAYPVRRMLLRFPIGRQTATHH